MPGQPPAQRRGRAAGGFLRCLVTLATVGPAFLASGCMTVTGSLASDTGPSPTGWSTHDQQLAVVNERVEFSFVLARSRRSPAPMAPEGIADYCLFTIGNELLEADLNAMGHYRLTYEFTGREPGETVPVSATAFRQRGVRDRMKVGDTWVHNEGPYDQPDMQIADDAIEMIIYECKVDLPVRRPGRDLDMAAGRLEIQKRDGETRIIHSESPYENGFRHTGPDAEGNYHVLYEPGPDEVNKQGITPIRFTAPDNQGEVHTIEAAIKTP